MVWRPDGRFGREAKAPRGDLPSGALELAGQAAPGFFGVDPPKSGQSFLVDNEPSLAVRATICVDACESASVVNGDPTNQEGAAFLELVTRQRPLSPLLRDACQRDVLT